MLLSLSNLKRYIPLCILLLGVVIAYQIIADGKLVPQERSKNKQALERIVQVKALNKQVFSPVWQASGYVIPSESIKVHAKVPGDVLRINQAAIPGAFLKQGEWLVNLDPVDYQITVRAQEAQVAQADASLALETADQVLAKEELALLNNDSKLVLDHSLVLREPQLAMAKAKLAVAQSQLEKAQLNLNRTVINMPFDGQIIDKYVGRSSKVSANTALFSITNTNRYWVEVKMPHRFIDLLDKNANYNLHQDLVWGENESRDAQFVSIMPQLDSKDRQVKILLSIDKPTTKLPLVFINDFIHVELKGKPLNDVWRLKHHRLQGDDSVWVVDNKDTLQKRSVQVLFKNREHIFVRGGFVEGDWLLAEKPGIVAVDLPVKPRRVRSDLDTTRMVSSNDDELPSKDNNQAGNNHEG